MTCRSFYWRGIRRSAPVTGDFCPAWLARSGGRGSISSGVPLNVSWHCWILHKIRPVPKKSDLRESAECPILTGPMSALSEKDILFAVAAALILALSSAVVLVRNPVRATFFLITSFIPTGAVYIFLHAPFVGVLQILVYAGAILILFTFVVMMINPGPGPAKEHPEDKKGLKNPLVLGIPFLIVGGAAVWKIMTSLRGLVSVTTEPSQAFGSLTSIGKLIFTGSADNPYTLAFELISFLILGGIVMAVNLSGSKR